ncbi:MAG: Lpg1974 family pore-forming outer membrane protein [Pirellulales bacterium]
MKILKFLTVLVLAQAVSQGYAFDRETVFRDTDSTSSTEMSLSDHGKAPNQMVYQQAGYVNETILPVASYDQASTLAPTATACGAFENLCAVECAPWWAHRSSVFGELLYLRPGDTNTIYAVQQTGIVPNSSPTGPLGFTSIREQLGFRVGFNQALTNKSSLYASYAQWDGDNFNTITATGTDVLNSTMIHPSTATVGAASLTAEARQRMGFRVVDAGLKRLYRASDCGIINWNLGLRYGYLKQGITANQTVSVANGTTSVDSNVKFNGFGIAGGLDGERRSASTGLLVYGRTMGSLLAGTWKANYRQANQLNPGVIGNDFQEFRVSPMIDAELGFGWRSACDGFRLTTGYLFSTWFNAVNDREYIQAVRDSRLMEISDAVTFSGLTFRAELRF